jgi:DASS family divalent anion:Na+ symporter
MLQPLPGGAVVLLGITAVILAGSLPINQALAGYSNPTVWLVLLAFLMARAFIKTGIARRIALYFLRALGNHSLGLAYALIFSDVAMATIIPANSSRAGGVILPIASSLADLYGSKPGKTAGLLGAFLMMVIYHGDVVAATMFVTGQASNVLAASMAGSVAGVTISWARWLWVASVPALVSLAVVPALLYWLNRPEISDTGCCALCPRAACRDGFAAIR